MQIKKNMCTCFTNNPQNYKRKNVRNCLLKLSKNSLNSQCKICQKYESIRKKIQKVYTINR